jgi:hypothetical protein
VTVVLGRFCASLGFKILPVFASRTSLVPPFFFVAMFVPIPSFAAEFRTDRFGPPEYGHTPT